MKQVGVKGKDIDSKAVSRRNMQAGGSGDGNGTFIALLSKSIKRGVGITALSHFKHFENMDPVDFMRELLVLLK